MKIELRRRFASPTKSPLHPTVVLVIMHTHKNQGDWCWIDISNMKHKKKLKKWAVIRELYFRREPCDEIRGLSTGWLAINEISYCLWYIKRHCMHESFVPCKRINYVDEGTLTKMSRIATESVGRCTLSLGAFNLIMRERILRYIPLKAFVGLC